jgi:hypothetical protein
VCAAPLSGGLWKRKEEMGLLLAVVRGVDCACQATLWRDEEQSRRRPAEPVFAVVVQGPKWTRACAMRCRTGSRSERSSIGMIQVIKPMEGYMKIQLVFIIPLILSCGNSRDTSIIPSAFASPLAIDAGSGGTVRDGGAGGTGGLGGTDGQATGGTGGNTDCWMDQPEDLPFAAGDERNAGAQNGALEGFVAAEARGCMQGVVGGMCQGGVVVWPNGWRGFCVRAAAWASAKACFAAEARACLPGACAVQPPVCVWARAYACAYANAYAFAWACAGGR